MNVRERFINSIEYLRKLGFFEEYSNLTSEEIFERISEGSILLKDLDEEEEEWARKSDFKMDTLVAIKDRKRLWGMDVEISPYQGFAEETFKEIAAISRGVFQPKDIEEEWLGWGSRIHFTFRGERHTLDFRFNYDFLDVGSIMMKINDLIKDTGYQYYEILVDSGQCVFAIVLTKWEAEKLVKERCWRLRSEWRSY
jgi:hypothetical protein